MLIDLNCDLGEGCPHDAEVMPLITSANVACGFHAGDPATAFATLALAAKHGVRVGAHPSFPDREDFGRREMDRSEQQVFEDCVYQIGALAGAREGGGVALTPRQAARRPLQHGLPRRRATPGPWSPRPNCSACR